VRDGPPGLGQPIASFFEQGVYAIRRNGDSHISPLLRQVQVRSVWQNYAVDASVFPSLQDAAPEGMASEEQVARSV
jgi:hypothetical protein